MKEVTHAFDWFLLIPILGIVGATFCGLLAIHARYKQRMVILKTGIKPEEKPYKRGFLLISGISMMAIGGALLGGFLVGFWWFGLNLPLVKGIGFITGLVFLLVGIALVVAYNKTREEAMKGLLKQINDFRKNNQEIKITLVDGNEHTGRIDSIIDDELLVLRKPPLIYIPIDKVLFFQ